MRMRPYHPIILFVAFAFAAGPGSAEAATLKDGPFVGYTSGGDLPDDTTVFGWQAAYEFTPEVSLEVAGSWQQHDLTEGIADPVSETDVDLQLGSVAVTAKAGWFVDPATFYVGAGAGYYIFDTDPDGIAASDALVQPGVENIGLDVDADDEPGYHLAVGMELLLSDQWEVFLEYRHIFLETDVTTTITTQQGTADEDTLNDFRRSSESSTESLSFDHGQVRIGVNYRF